jgi:hypothetical protein
MSGLPEFLGSNRLIGEGKILIERQVRQMIMPHRQRDMAAPEAGESFSVTDVASICTLSTRRFHKPEIVVRDSVSRVRNGRIRILPSHAGRKALESSII